MEKNFNTTTTTASSINYNFIAVPTQLFILLDYRLKLVLTSMLQVSSALANTEGWFYYSIDDLKKLSGIKSDKTVRAAIETLYRLNLVEVKARTFENNIGKRTANYYRINFNEIEKYNELSVYECLNIEELHIPMLDYTKKDYKTTYTASTPTETEEKAVSEASGTSVEETPSTEQENATEGQETALNEESENNTTADDVETAESPTVAEEEKDEFWFLDEEADDEPSFDACGTDITEELKELKQQTEDWNKAKEIETASVMPSDLYKAEYRSFSPAAKKIDENVIKKCYDLANRYCEMEIPSSNQSLKMCNDALAYIRDKFNKGLIAESDMKRLQTVIIEARFKKHRI